MTPPQEDEVRALVEEAAEEYLSGPTTVEVTAWDDGDYRIVAYSSIEATYPLQEELDTPGGLDGDDARPFYRERVAYSTTDRENHVFLQVVRRRTGRTEEATVYEKPVAFVGPRDGRVQDAASDVRDAGTVNLDLGPGGGGVPPAAGTVQLNGEPVGRLTDLNVTIEERVDALSRSEQEEIVRKLESRDGVGFDGF